MNEKSKRLIDELAHGELHSEWDRIEGERISRYPDNSIECVTCGNSIAGDAPTVYVECRDCFVSRRLQGKETTSWISHKKGKQ